MQVEDSSPVKFGIMEESGLSIVAVSIDYYSYNKLILLIKLYDDHQGMHIKLTLMDNLSRKLTCLYVLSHA